MKIKILFEDKNLLVINKPAGISVHSDGKIKFACSQDNSTSPYSGSKQRVGEEKTIADWILEKYPKIKKVGEPFELEIKGGEKIKIYRPGIVHRLDKETSGILLIAKNQKTFLFLKEQFQNHKIKKIYKAFVYGYVTDPKASLATGKRGVINAPIGRSPNDVRMWTAGRGARQPLRDATTEYVVLSKFKDPSVPTNVGTSPPGRGEKEKETNFSFLELYPKTGRTHQIRVHMRYINHPIVSDPLYRGAKEMALGMKRLALHAYSITFSLPSGELKTIESPLPDDFKKALKTYVD